MPTRNKNGEYVFREYPDFLPNLSPRDIFKLGAFGGTYWRPIHSAVTNKNYNNVHKKYPASWWIGIPENWLILNFEDYDKSVNRHGVKVGTTLEFWEDKNWISPYHPYGWVQWYCDFFMGKRCPDDARQVDRWIKTAGPNSRFRKRLINMIIERRGTFDDNTSPAIRQTLLHWGYELKPKDLHISN